MQADIFSTLRDHNVDRQLVDAVQCCAGARCPESARLLYCYYLCALAYEECCRHNDDADTDSILKLMQDSEINLRKFLFQCRLPERFGSAAFLSQAIGD